MKWTEIYQISCENTSFRALSQTQTPNLHCRTDKQLVINRALMHKKASFTLTPLNIIMLKLCIYFRSRSFAKMQDYLVLSKNA